VRISKCNQITSFPVRLFIFSIGSIITNYLAFMFSNGSETGSGKTDRSYSRGSGTCVPHDECYQKYEPKARQEWRASASSRQQKGFKPKTECEIVDHTKKESERTRSQPRLLLRKKKRTPRRQVVIEVRVFALSDNSIKFYA